MAAANAKNIHTNKDLEIISQSTGWRNYKALIDEKKADGVLRKTVDRRLPRPVHWKPANPTKTKSSHDPARSCPRYKTRAAGGASGDKP